WRSARPERTRMSSGQRQSMSPGVQTRSVERVPARRMSHKDSDKIARPWGVARVPLAYHPSAAQASELHFARHEPADPTTLVRCWLQAEPARQLPKMKNVPSAIVTGEASFRATYDHCTSKFLIQAGVRNTHLRLEKVGLHGNGHMMMLEQNSAAIAEVIANWLDQNMK